MKRHIAQAAVLVALAALASGCATTTTIRHPSVYETKGRPAWTYDENRYQEDLAGETHLVEELRIPDEYHFFLGGQTVFLQTEENARRGALLDAINNFKAFLRTTGRTALEENRGAGLGKAEAREFETRMDAVADAETRQLKTVRWYIEEERTQPSMGKAYSRWRAWCLAAFPKARCDAIYEDMADLNRQLSQKRVDNLGQEVTPALPPNQTHAEKPEKKRVKGGISFGGIRIGGLVEPEN